VFAGERGGGRRRRAGGTQEINNRVSSPFDTRPTFDNPILRLSERDETERERERERERASVLASPTPGFLETVGRGGGGGGDEMISTKVEIKGPLGPPAPPFSPQRSPAPLPLEPLALSRRSRVSPSPPPPAPSRRPLARTRASFPHGPSAKFVRRV